MPRQTAEKMKSKYNTSDPLEIAACEKVTVVPWDLHHQIKGFYKYIRRSKYIFYNMNIDCRMKRFVCAHELGHALLHPRANTPFLKESTFFSVDRIEVEANKFAVELLMPSDILCEHRNLSIYEIAATAGVPKELAHLKKYEFS